MKATVTHYLIFASFVFLSCGAEQPSFQENVVKVASADGTDISVIKDTQGYVPASDGSSSVANDDALREDAQQVADTTELTTGETIVSIQQPKKSGGKNIPAGDEVTPGNDSSTEGGIEAPSEDELKQCGKQFGRSVTRIVVANKHQALKFNPDTALAIKLTGKGNAISLNFAAKETNYPGVCIFIAGTQNSAMITVGENVVLNKLLVAERGNAASTKVKVQAAASIERTSLDLSGNKPSFVIEGPGSFTCPTGLTSGNSAKIECK